MKRFFCGCARDNKLFFDSTRCVECARLTGFCPDRGVMLAFDPGPGDTCFALIDGRPRYRRCANYRDHNLCNWMIADDDAQPLCIACRLNTVIPDLRQGDNTLLWSRLEAAKRHALYTVLSLRLPMDGLRFRFMADADPEQDTVITGHCDGEITLNISEADPVARTHARLRLGERYRTLLGHFRHELGHYFWSRLIAENPERLAAFRERFGDERADYRTRQDNYYRDGPAYDWVDRHISPYASMHPWEDWAESWAHFMHMTDTLETAADFQLHLSGHNKDNMPESAHPLEHWMMLTPAMNALNRSMGQEDVYPFVLNETVRTKLDWIGRLVAAHEAAIDAATGRHSLRSTP